MKFLFFKLLKIKQKQNIKYIKLALILINFYIIIYKKQFEILKVVNNLRDINRGNFSQFSKMDKEQLFRLEKIDLLKFLSKGVGKNIKKIRQIFLKQKFRFGNQIILIYKVIFYCQILECKKIILGKNEHNWFIKNTILDKKYRMKIEVAEENNIKNFDTLIDETANLFYYSKYLKPVFRVGLLRNEIFKNLPRVSININDLYIYIRSGDIFASKKPHSSYVQPPFCYYMKVINNYEFRKIHLIAENENNPVITKLLDIYPYIIYNKNPLKLDIAKLINAYNIVGGGTSTFLSQILLLNVKLKVLWNFIFKQRPFNLSLKIDIKDLYIENRITNFAMFASKDYIDKMIPWNNSKIQRDFMLNYNCPNYFIFNNYYYIYI